MQCRAGCFSLGGQFPYGRARLRPSPLFHGSDGASPSQGWTAEAGVGWGISIGKAILLASRLYQGSDSRPQGDRLAEGKSEALKASPSRGKTEKTRIAPRLFYSGVGNLENQAVRRRRRITRAARPTPISIDVFGSGITVSVPFVRKLLVCQESPLPRVGRVPSVAPEKLPVVRSNVFPKTPVYEPPKLMVTPETEAVPDPKNRP